MRLLTTAEAKRRYREASDARQQAEAERGRAYRDFPRRYRSTFATSAEEDWRPVQIACQNLDAAIRKVRELEAAEVLAWNRYQERKRVEAQAAPTW